MTTVGPSDAGPDNAGPHGAHGAHPSGLGPSGLGPGATDPRDDGPAPTAADTVITALRELSTTLRTLEAPAREDLPDAVHRTRTTTRRLRSLIGMHGGLFLDTTKPLKASLRRLGAALGPARDAEVQLELTADRTGDPALIERMGAAHARAHAHLVRDLDAGALTDVVDTVDAGDPAPSELGARPAARVLPAVLEAEIDRVRGAEIMLDSGAASELEDRRHDLRKAARRLRYGAEAVIGTGAVDDVAVHALADAANRVQDVFGLHRDLLLLADILGTMHGAEAAVTDPLRDEAEQVLRDAPAALEALLGRPWALPPHR